MSILESITRLRAHLYNWTSGVRSLKPIILSIAFGSSYNALSFSRASAVDIVGLVRKKRLSFFFFSYNWHSRILSGLSRLLKSRTLLISFRRLLFLISSLIAVLDSSMISYSLSKSWAALADSLPRWYSNLT